MSDKPERFIDEKGQRLDGRSVDEIRPMTVEMGVLSRADGSCYLEWGNNKVLAAVYGPRELHPRRMQRYNEVLLRYRYNMAAFSVEDRIRPGPSRRSTEISKVSGEAFEPVIMKQFYPGAVIDVFVEVLQADAGTRTAGINAASLALVDAGIPMKGLIAACAVGKVDGQLVLDLNKPEDNYGDADLPVAMTEDGEITLLQMDGNLKYDEFIQGMEMVKAGCQQIFKIQKEALMNRFGPTSSEAEEPDNSDEVKEPTDDESFDPEDGGSGADEVVETEDSDAEESEDEGTGDKEPDDEESDGEESDGEESDDEESDDEESDDEESDDEESDDKESDDKESDIVEKDDSDDFDESVSDDNESNISSEGEDKDTSDSEDSEEDNGSSSKTADAAGDSPDEDAEDVRSRFEEDVADFENKGEDNE